MYRIWAAIAAVLCAGLAVAAAADEAYSQEVQLATFQETAQVLVDRTLSGNVTASVTLQSTSNQEIKIPSELAQKIRANPAIISVVLTNQEGCGVLGVSGQSCILVNVARSGNDTNILKVQQSARMHGDLVIGDLNALFDADASYHSGYLHHRDGINVMLGTSGAVSGRDVVSAVYTMDMEETGSMYQKISALTLDRRIRDSGGFFEAAKSLSAHENAHMTLSIIPGGSKSLFQLRVSAEHPGAEDTDRFSPLDFLGVDEIKRSGYFEGGFYPLNSILQVVMLSPQQIELRNINTNSIPAREIGGEMIPTEFNQNGWVFDTTTGTKIEGKYLFGTRTSASSNELSLAFGAVGEHVDEPAEDYDSIVIVAIIAVFGAAIAAFYLRGYGRGR